MLWIPNANKEKALARHSSLGENGGLRYSWCLGAGDNEKRQDVVGPVGEVDEG